MDKLKPCPFCGGGKIEVKYLYCRPYIICDKCHAQIPCYNNYPSAKEAWNRRADTCTEEAITFAKYAQIMADGKPDVQEFYRLAQAALRAQQERENPEPLTLEELRTITNQPVYLAIIDSEIDSGWLCCQGGYKDRDGRRYIKFSEGEFDEECFACGDVIAYRHKPEGGANGNY